ncbi:hypothetical protein C8F04DRAFT_1228656 [Mycena alexandri]|uniref:DUF6534 domain-containing protein n=1 Tax=Mycena alexandri TaxID=1745969 RepID=A0AAD6XGD5_9AGAR|nr:hypothetical protein C8F04DRAFT_1228656 [Mycena alexandri]
MDGDAMVIPDRVAVIIRGTIAQSPSSAAFRVWAMGNYIQKDGKFDPMSGVILSRASLIPLDNFLGAWLIGLIVASVFFGVTCLQVYLYFTKHSARDPVFLKTFVVLLLALDTLHLALVSHAFYFATVTNFGDYVELGTAPWFNDSISFQVKYFSLASEDLPYFAASLSIKVACDVLIASAMENGLPQVEPFLFWRGKTLIFQSIFYHAVSSQNLHCRQFVALPSTLIYAPFFFVLVRLYTLSFLSILNSRDHVREQLFSIAHAMITIPSPYTGDSSTLPADAETGMTGAEKGTGKVSGSVFSTTGEEGPRPHPTAYFLLLLSVRAISAISNVELGSQSALNRDPLARNWQTICSIMDR